uniref:Secreted protein n=1 Tax=Streptomyces sp. NBC_00049 TaxID=2903617 RepID=A0AAU2K1M6_9ACTN
MRTTTRTLTATLILAAALAGCSSNSPDSKPAPATSSASPAPAPSRALADVTRDCTTAVADRVAAAPGSADMEPRPPACAPLSDGEYATAFIKGLQQSNKAARDRMQKEIDEEQAKAG